MQRKVVHTSMDSTTPPSMEAISEQLTRILDELAEIRNTQLQDHTILSRIPQPSAETKVIDSTPPKPTTTGGGSTAPKGTGTTTSRPNFLKSRFTNPKIDDYDIAVGKVPPRDGDPYSYPGGLLIIPEDDLMSKDLKIKNAKDSLTRRKSVADYMWHHYTVEQKKILGQYLDKCSNQKVEPDVDPSTIDSNSEP